MKNYIFTTDEVEKAKKFYYANVNAGTNRLPCINTLNKGLKILLSNQNLKTDTEIQTTMQKLKEQNLVSEPVIINFLDKTGKETKGASEPEKLKNSLYDEIVKLAGEGQGFMIIGLSLMDGYHSITLVVDKTDTNNPKIYWNDQHESWKKYGKDELDKIVAEKTKRWWNKKLQESNVRFKTHITIWKIYKD